MLDYYKRKADEHLEAWNVAQDLSDDDKSIINTLRENGYNMIQVKL